MVRAIVAGATGAVGRALTTQLRESDTYGDVHLLLRRRIHTSNPKLIQHIVDFSCLDDVSIDRPIDHVFCALGTTQRNAGSKQAFREVDHDYVVSVGRLAARFGATMVVVSSIGASSRSMSFYLKVKGQAEDSLKRLGLRRLVIVRPSLLLARRQEARPMEEVAAGCSKWLKPFLIGPMRRYRPVRVEDVASRMIELAIIEGARVEVVESELL